MKSIITTLSLFISLSLFGSEIQKGETALYYHLVSPTQSILIEYKIQHCMGGSDLVTFKLSRLDGAEFSEGKYQLTLFKKNGKEKQNEVSIYDLFALSEFFDFSELKSLQSTTKQTFNLKFFDGDKLLSEREVETTAFTDQMLKRLLENEPNNKGSCRLSSRKSD
jgi:hypothetical protein